MPFTFVVIISGGEKREKAYFAVISNRDTFQRIKVEFTADPTMDKGKGNPDKLLELAKRKQEHYATSQEGKPDEIFIVSDVDEFTDSLLRIKPACKTANIHLIISNSCFEVWLYYGKFSHKPADFSIPEDVSKISQSFKTYLGGKVKGGVDPRKAVFDIYENIRNAKANYTEGANDIPELFSTNMFLLAEAILPFIQDELDRLISGKIKDFEN
ncbi:MAG: RloB family protein [Tannerella sp.]|nr:RloB family protein [Tannerella sp.]